MMYYNVVWKASTAASNLVKGHVATCFGCVRECFHSLPPAHANRQGPSYNMLHLTLCPPPADLFLPESPEQRVRRRESPDFSAVQQLHATGAGREAGDIQPPDDQVSLPDVDSPCMRAAHPDWRHGHKQQR